MDKPYAVQTFKDGRWQVRRFARESNARRFRIAESRRLRTNLSVTRLTKVKGLGLVTEVEGYMPGTWVKV